MKDSMKNFKEETDLILKNIYVTDELKRKTLEKCTHRKLSIIKPKLTAAVSAALIVSFGIGTYYFQKPAITDNQLARSISQEHEKSLDNEGTIQESPKTTESSDSGKSPSAASNSESNIKNNVTSPQKKNVDIAMKDSSNISESKSIDSVNENTETTLPIINDSSKTSDSVSKNRVDISDIDSNSDININSNSKLNSEARVYTSLALMPKTLTVEKAEKYFESKIVLPSYIPEGFKLTDISIPDDKEKCVKLQYSSSSANFEILQSKNLSKLSGTKNIPIGNNTAYINSSKDEKTNIITTKITWTMDNIQYSLSSSLPEDSLIKIAKSINN